MSDTDSEDEREKSRRNDREGEMEAMLYDEEAGTKKRSSRSRWWTMASVIGFIWVLSGLFFLFQGGWRSHSHDPIAHNRRVSFDDARSLFWPRTRSIDWTGAYDDGFYFARDGGKIMLSHVDGSQTLFADEMDFRAAQLKDSPILQIQGYAVSPDAQYILLTTDTRSNWRHSTFARYWVHNVATKETASLSPNVNANIAYAAWSPSGHSIAYVLDNDIWVRPDLGSTRRVTTDGSQTVFNGIPDWVYEEEVLQTSNALWWSSDSRSIAFLQINNSAVNEYPLEFFITPTPPEPEIYPEVESLRYPKPGTPNPVAHLFRYDLETESASQLDVGDKEKIISEVKWLGSKVFHRETNRDATVQDTFVDGDLVDSLNVTTIDGGWFEVTRNTLYVPASHGRKSGYVDRIIYKGNRHLALITDTTTMLTTGDWEVVEGTLTLDTVRDLVYFIATKHSGIDRHLYSVNLSTSEITSMSGDEPGYYSATFTPSANYYILNYAGPGVPWQKIRKVDSDFEMTLEANDLLRDTLDRYDLPQKIYSTITIDGLEMNTVELRPPNFDPSGKTQYPVLFNPYGGPHSQSVSHKFGVDWHSWLASDPHMDYIVVTVDGRGTGFMGRKLRTPVRGKIGYWEAHDQIEAAKIWQARPYTDSQRFAIWGWSFGGYLTLKVLEAGTGIFQYGMAVAPVTDWRFYDSVYTERYMGTLEDNKEGYQSTAITNITGFSQAKRFLIMHGTGDDNVHFQNTLSLVDQLNLASIENYDMHVFPDSDHGIYFHSANKQVYHRLSNFLRQAFGLRDPLAEDRSWKGAGWGVSEY